jgi:outer membrane protein, heavy metal efflux system
MGCATPIADTPELPPARSSNQRSIETDSAPATAAASNAVIAIKEPTGPLTLRDALALALMENPELSAFAWQTRAVEARVLQASLRPNPELGLQVEDILGTGQFRGLRQAQITLQLSQVIELGGKRAARMEVAAQGRDIAKSEYEIKRVEVLGDVTQRFILVVANQHALDLALTNRELAKDAFRTVSERAQAGRASALEEEKAQVALARAELLVEGAQHELRAARKKLAVTWRSNAPVFERAEADLFARKTVPAFENLASRVSRSPEILRWVSERKLREAEIRLADARRVPNITVGGGIRRLEGPGDQAFVLGASMPLPIFDRHQGTAAEARALLGRAEADQHAAEFRLNSVLLGIREEMEHDVHIMEGQQKDILPKAERALAVARDGFSQGRFSYLEVLDAQRTLFEVHQELIRAATSYHQFVAEMERLIGQPFDQPDSQP